MQRPAPSPMKPVLNRTQVTVNASSHVSHPGTHPMISRTPAPQPMTLSHTAYPSPSPPMQNRGLNRAQQQEVRYRSSPNLPIAQPQPANTSAGRARHSSVEGVPKGGGRGSVQGPRLGIVNEEEVPGRMQPRGPSPHRPGSLQPGNLKSAQAQQPVTESRLQYLESELASFTSKMTEMRSAAEALQEEVRVVRPSLDGTGKAPSSAATSTGPPQYGGSDEMDSEANGTWVLEALKKVIADRDRNDHSHSPQHGSTSSTAGNESVMQEMRNLRHEVRLEAEARKQLSLKMEAMFLDEKKKREEVVRLALVQREEQDSKMEQRWLNQLKEESGLRRAVEGHLEARLVALQREARLEAGNATNQAQQAVGEFAQMRERFQQEINAQKQEIGRASADLSRLIDEVRNHGGGIKADMGMPSAEITENLIRAEVRRQLAERPAQADVATSLELQALSTRLERMEQALANEATKREEESSKSISMLHELMSELGKSQMQALREFEDNFKTKLNAAMSEAQAAQQSCAEERQLRRQQLTKESKDRDETCMTILKTMEERIGMESKQLQKLLADQRFSFEQQLRGHDRELQSTMEMSVANFVEKHSQEVVSARHDLLELREEVQEAVRNKRFDQASASATTQGEVQRLVEGQTKLWATLDQVRHDFGEELQRRDTARERNGNGSGTLSGLSNLDIEELRTQIAAERLAREQGDDRCMENARDLVNEEEKKRVREIDALENRLSNVKAVTSEMQREETTKATFLAGTRAATTSACPQGTVVTSSIVRPASSNMLQAPPWPKPPSFSA